jgi:hypothetical protein
VQGGQAQAGEILLVNYANEWPVFGADGLPFLADSYDEAAKLYKAQKPELDKKLAEQGMMLLYTVPWPPQGIYLEEAGQLGGRPEGRSGAPTARRPRASPSWWARSR